MSTVRFDNLAGVRGLAAAIVLISHVVQIHLLRFVGLNTPLHHISSVSSEYAVVVFFILSGYLITHSLESNVKRNGRLRLWLFTAARIARLYPPFLYAIGISLTIFLTMDLFNLPGRNSPLRLPGDLYAAREIVHLSLGEIKNALLMLQGMLEINGPLWSLYIEAKIYVLYACALGLLLGKRNLVQMLLLIAVFLFVAKAGIELNPGFAAYAAVWLIGALSYYIWNNPRNWRSRILLCSGLITCCIALESWHALQDKGVPGSVILNIMISSVIGWLLFKLRIRVPVGRTLANCSYSLYVIHFPVLLLAQSILIATGNKSGWVAIAVAAASILAASGFALIGGAIEAKKSIIQNMILSLVGYLRHRRETS